ncbi:MAG: trypsin-like peptidase domain-containing protein [Cardiobacteriaceae bacterium]|nr:trypsin-like peptidase domain-containing protein [Cardiobacteriaceae bacterium]
MFTLMRCLPVICAFVLPAAQAIQCERAQTAPELAICRDPQLQARDAELGNIYNSIRAELPAEAFALVRADQRQWLQARDAQCGGDAACLLEKTRERIVFFQEFRAVLGDLLREIGAATPGERQGGTQREKPVSGVYVAKPVAPAAANLRAGERTLNPQEIYQVAARSSVVVLPYDGGRRIGQGSGVEIADNLVATNCHVVENGDEFLVLFAGESYPATLVSGDSDMDYCLLHAPGLPADNAIIAASGTLSPGQRVYSVGSPKGFELTIGEGLISGIRDIDGTPMIQTSAPISAGSSGGGLYNERGELVGITTAGHKDAENLNFAVPADFAYILAENALNTHSP